MLLYVYAAVKVIPDGRQTLADISDDVRELVDVQLQEVGIVDHVHVSLTNPGDESPVDVNVVGDPDMIALALSMED